MDTGSLKHSQALGWALLTALLALVYSSAGFRLVNEWQRYSAGRADLSSLLASGGIFTILAGGTILSLRRATGLRKSAQAITPTPGECPGTQHRDIPSIRIAGLKNPDAVEHWFDTCMAEIVHVIRTGPDSADIAVGDSIDVNKGADREFVTGQIKMALSACGENQGKIEFLGAPDLESGSSPAG